MEFCHGGFDDSDFEESCGDDKEAAVAATVYSCYSVMDLTPLPNFRYPTNLFLTMALVMDFCQKVAFVPILNTKVLTLIVIVLIFF